MICCGPLRLSAAAAALDKHKHRTGVEEQFGKRGTSSVEAGMSHVNGCFMSEAEGYDTMSAEAGNSDLVASMESMELDELRQLRKDIDRAISSYENRQRKAAFSAAEQIASEHGFRLTDLVGGRQSGKSKRAGEAAPSGQPAYANPDNPEQTWTGRGRRPGWFVDALAAGRTTDDMAV